MNTEQGQSINPAKTAFVFIRHPCPTKYLASYMWLKGVGNIHLYKLSLNWDNRKLLQIIYGISRRTQPIWSKKIWRHRTRIAVQDAKKAQKLTVPFLKLKVGAINFETNRFAQINISFHRIALFAWRSAFAIFLCFVMGVCTNCLTGEFVYLHNISFCSLYCKREILITFLTT